MKGDLGRGLWSRGWMSLWMVRPCWLPEHVARGDPRGRDAQEGLCRLSDWPRVCPQTWAVAWHTLPQLSPPGWQGGLLNPVLWVRAALSQTPTPGHIVTAALSQESPDLAQVFQGPGRS